MHTEISSAAEFIGDILRVQQHKGRINETQLDLFKGSLTSLLKNRYREHWFPERPSKGSAYRCIRINRKMDPIIAQAGVATGLPPTYLRSLFPHELTLWIDPEEVSYRIGENGSICVLYEKSKEEKEKVQPPRQSPELYLDPRQMETIDPMVDFYY